MKILITLPCPECHSCCAAGAVLNAFTRITLFSLMTTLSGRHHCHCPFPVGESLRHRNVKEVVRGHTANHRPECILSVVRATDYQQTAGQKHSDTIYTVVCDTGNTPKSSQRPLMPETMQDELPYSSMLTSALELVFSFHTGCDEYLHKLKQPCHQRY